MLGTLLLLTVGMRAHAVAEEAGRIEHIELQGEGPSTKVVIALSRPREFHVQVLDGDPAKKRARRLVLDFANTTLAPTATKPIATANELVRQIRPGQFNARTARIVLDLGSDATHSIDAVESPPQVTIALAGSATTGTAPAAGTTKLETPPAGADTNVETAPAVAETTTKVEAPSAVAAEASKPTAVRPIPIRARGRRPYSLNYSR
ncbi:MAG: AMIN domain-containing protein [Candidatus Binatia bacterium]